MNNEVKHTPTPWKNGFKRMDESVVISSGGLGLTIAVIHQGAINNAEANAAHIVKCVNLHDELVEAIQDLICAGEFRRGCEDLKSAREVLKKAGAL